jgi:hypothetical protein
MAMCRACREKTHPSLATDPASTWGELLPKQKTAVIIMEAQGDGIGACCGILLRYPSHAHAFLRKLRRARHASTRMGRLCSKGAWLATRARLGQVAYLAAPDEALEGEALEVGVDPQRHDHHLPHETNERERQWTPLDLDLCSGLPGRRGWRGVRSGSGWRGGRGCRPRRSGCGRRAACP